jgi:hypothetical protein
MKSRAGGHIHIHIGVVHAMETPEDGHVVKDSVLEVNREIQQHQSSKDFEPGGQRNEAKKPPPS